MLKRNVWEWNSLVVAHCNSVHGWLSRNWVGWGEDTSKTLLCSFVTLFENEYEELLYTLIKLVLAHIHFCSSSYLNTRHSNMVKKRRKTVLLSSIRPSSFAVLSFQTFPPSFRPLTWKSAASFPSFSFLVLSHVRYLLLWFLYERRPFIPPDDMSLWEQSLHCYNYSNIV